MGERVDGKHPHSLSRLKRARCSSSGAAGNAAGSGTGAAGWLQAQVTWWGLRAGGLGIPAVEVKCAGCIGWWCTPSGLCIATGVAALWGAKGGREGTAAYEEVGCALLVVIGGVAGLTGLAYLTGLA